MLTVIFIYLKKGIDESFVDVLWRANVWSRFVHGTKHRSGKLTSQLISRENKFKLNLKLWQVLKNIASTGKTVVCTIHQPSSEVFEMFDRILLMADGRTAFLGPASDALYFFSSKGLPCPPNYNPADYYIHTLATIPGQEAESKKKSKEICDAYDSSEAGQQIQEIVKANRSLNSAESQEFELAEVKVKRTPYKASWFAQLRAVFWRSVISVFREPVVLRVKIFQTIVSSYNCH